MENHISQLWTSQNLPHLGNLRVWILNKPRNWERREAEPRKGEQGSTEILSLEPAPLWDAVPHSYSLTRHGATSRGLNNLTSPPRVIPPPFHQYLVGESLVGFLPLQIFFSFVIF